MQSSGNSEFSDSKRKTYSLGFWQNFLLTLISAAGLISLVADGPHWVTYPSFVLVISILFIASISKLKK